MSSKPKSLRPAGELRQEGNVSEDDSLGELRRIILGHMETQLVELQMRLDDPRVRAKEVSRILPEAVTRSSSKDENLGYALVPAVEQAFRLSVKRNARVLADALFPVMGSAIRKAIAEALRGMLQTLNEALEKSFSWRGIRWRWEASRTKMPLSEIILLHSIVYRVEQLFLIHRQTGLLLQHVIREETEFQDADMVSSMLSAIRDFVADSFKIEEQDSLETIRVGELTVWIEQGPMAVLAAVIRGNAPEVFRTVLQENLENIHSHYADALESFDGETSPFESASPALEACLCSEYKQDRKKFSPVPFVVAAALVVALATWGGIALRDRWRWNDLLAKLHATEGIVITAAEKRDGTYLIRGLRDDLAADPTSLLGEARIEPDRVVFRWTPYQSLSESFVLRRAQRILNPPDTVALRLENGVLVADGQAPHEWVVKAHGLVESIPGISSFQTDLLIDTDADLRQAIRDYVAMLKREKGIVVTSVEQGEGGYRVSGLRDPLAGNPAQILAATTIPEDKIQFQWEPYYSLDPDLILKRAMKILTPPDGVSMSVKTDGCLVVAGAVSHRWINELIRWGRTVPGVACVDDSGLDDLDMLELLSLKKRIESENIFFLPNSPHPVPDQMEKMELLAEHIRTAEKLAGNLSLALEVRISGHADRVGSEDRNRRLSKLRGDRVFAFLVSRGITQRILSVDARGASQPLLDEQDEVDRGKNRRVSFQIILGEEAPKNELTISK